ncbi:MAG: hypothetical protein J6C82_02670 [Clostridia bacterium]|nr:hypothetical protein [Clostridia bacterium]
MENKDIIDFAVILIEEEYKGVDKLKYGLNCRQITMRQLGEEGEGFIVEFYGIGCLISENTIEKTMDELCGQWKIIRDGRDLKIRCSFNSEYFGSWNSFNKDVWREVRRKHQSWNIKEVYPYKNILTVE